jgi:hypothetical protein
MGVELEDVSGNVYIPSTRTRFNDTSRSLFMLLLVGYVDKTTAEHTNCFTTLPPTWLSPPTTTHTLLYRRSVKRVGSTLRWTRSWRTGHLPLNPHLPHTSHNSN